MCKGPPKRDDRIIVPSIVILVVTRLRRMREGRKAAFCRVRIADGVALLRPQCGPYRRIFRVGGLPDRLTPPHAAEQLCVAVERNFRPAQEDPTAQSRISTGNPSHPVTRLQ